MVEPSNTSGIAFAVVAIVTSGCSNCSADDLRSDPPAPSAATQAVPAASSAASSASASAVTALPAIEPVVRVTGKLDQHSFEFRHGSASWRKDNLEVVLSSKPFPCGAPAQNVPAPLMRFQIPPGPGGRFYSGGAVGLGARIEASGEHSSEFPARSALVQLDEVEPQQGGAITGSLALRGRGIYGADRAEVSGVFSVRVCESEPHARPTGVPEEPPPEVPAIRSAIALLHNPDSGLIDEIWLFPDTVTRCGAPGLPHAYSFFSIANFGALRVDSMNARGPQPAELRFHPPVPRDDNGHLLSARTDGLDIDAGRIS